MALPIRDRRDADWFWMNKSILDIYAPQVGSIGIAVYAMLARCANTDGHAFPSVRYIARHLKLSTNTVLKYLGMLQDCNLIASTLRKSTHGDKDTTQYTLFTPAIPTAHEGVALVETPSVQDASSPVNKRQRGKRVSQPVQHVSQPVQHGVSVSETPRHDGVSQPVQHVSQPVQHVSQLVNEGVSPTETFKDLREQEEQRKELSPLPPLMENTAPPGPSMHDGTPPLDVPPKRKAERSGKIVQAKAKAILDYFNAVHGHAYENASVIEALLRSPKLREPTLEDCKLVIDYLYAVERIEDPDAYKKYVTHTTPFRPETFERHRERARQWEAQGRPDPKEASSTSTPIKRRVAL
jgi:Helix-turn-helix domain